MSDIPAAAPTAIVVPRPLELTLVQPHSLTGSVAHVEWALTLGHRYHWSTEYRRHQWWTAILDAQTGVELATALTPLFRVSSQPTRLRWQVVADSQHPDYVRITVVDAGQQQSLALSLATWKSWAAVIHYRMVGVHHPAAPRLADRQLWLTEGRQEVALRLPAGSYTTLYAQLSRSEEATTVHPVEDYPDLVVRQSAMGQWCEQGYLRVPLETVLAALYYRLVDEHLDLTRAARLLPITQHWVDEEPPVPVLVLQSGGQTVRWPLVPRLRAILDSELAPAPGLQEVGDGLSWTRLSGGLYLRCETVTAWGPLTHAWYLR